MKHVELIIVIIVSFLVSFGGGFYFSELMQTCPVTQCDIMDVKEEVKKAYCKIAEPITIVERIPVYITKECATCDCSLDLAAGREAGWKDCINSYDNGIESRERATNTLSPRNYRR